MSKAAFMLLVVFLMFSINTSLFCKNNKSLKAPVIVGSRIFKPSSLRLNSSAKFMSAKHRAKFVRKLGLGHKIAKQKSISLATTKMHQGSTYIEFFKPRLVAGSMRSNYTTFSCRSLNSNSFLRLVLNPWKKGDYLVELLVHTAKNCTITSGSSEMTLAATSGRVVFVINCDKGHMVQTKISGRTSNKNKEVWVFKGLKVSLIE